ncbi:MAG: hypothetical protein ACFCU7_06815 [Pleurocapsa sp.]
MFIHDLEFIDSFDREYRRDNLGITGGASASTIANTSTTDGAVFATASASASGDYNRSQATTGAKLLVKSPYLYGGGYIAGYGTGYGIAYGADRYSTAVTDQSVSTSVL